MKKLFLLAGMAGMLLIFSSCTTQGYVSSEPSYVEYSRPSRPSELHVWVDGNWVYNRSSQAYVRQNGSWHKPNRGRHYVDGRWQSSPRGMYWQDGYWSR